MFMVIRFQPAGTPRSTGGFVGKGNNAGGKDEPRGTEDTADNDSRMQAAQLILIALTRRCVKENGKENPG